MSGICSAHRHREPGCPRCAAIPPGARFLRPSDHWAWDYWPVPQLFFLAAFANMVWAIVMAVITT